MVIWTPVALLVFSRAADDPRGWALVVAGLLVTPIVGAFFGRRATDSRGLGAGTAALFSLTSVLAGALSFGLLVAILDGRNPIDAVGFGMVGIAFFGVPFLILGFNLGLIWVALTRRVKRG